MNPDLAFGLGIFVFAFGLCAALVGFALVWLGGREDHRNHEQARERAAQALLRPSSGQIEAAPRDCPFDYEAELQKDQAFVYSLHLIDSAFPSNLQGPISDEKWSRLLGDSRH